MKVLLSFAACLFISVAGFSQKITPEWSFPIEGTPESVFIQQFTGIPVVETSTYYYGVNSTGKTALWKMPKVAAYEGLNKLSKWTSVINLDKYLKTTTSVQDMIPELSNFQEIPYTPYVSIGCRFVDVSTGKVVFGGKENPYMMIVDFHLVPEASLLLVEVKNMQDANILFCIDLQTSELKWQKRLSKELSKKVVFTVSGGFEDYPLSVFQAQSTPNGDILYKFEKSLLLLSGKDGGLLWESECHPGICFVDKQGTNVVVVEQAGTSGLVSTTTTVNGKAHTEVAYSPKNALGKKVFALNLATGKSVWSPIKLANRYVMHADVDNNQTIIGNKNSVNVYSYATGQALWAKDFPARNLIDILEQEDGYEVFYGNKLMLISKAGGEKSWTKPIELELSDDENGGLRKEYQQGLLVGKKSSVKFLNKTTGKTIWSLPVSAEAQIAVDNYSGRVALVDGKKLYLFQPDESTGKPEKLKLDIEAPQELLGFEMRTNGYFFQGMSEYIVTDTNGNILEHKHYQQLSNNSKINALSWAASVAATIAIGTLPQSQNNGRGRFMPLSDEYVLETLNEMQQRVAYQLKWEDKWKKSSTSGREFAYYVKGSRVDKEDLMSLVQVDKNTGKETKTYPFGTNRNLCFGLDLQAGIALVVTEGEVLAFSL